MDSFATTNDFSPLVAGVAKITSSGLAGPIYPEDTNWVAIVAGDDDSSYPFTYVLARNYGAGRVVIIGHEGIVERLDLLDNKQFILNAIAWLDLPIGKKVLATAPHSQLQPELQSRGYTFSIDAIGTTNLSGKNVLIAGNAWTDFAASEISSVTNFVANGGGLLLLGLGWSWAAYHPSMTMEDYPMMKLARPFGVRWLPSYIDDPSNQTNGSAVFHVFYPNVQMGTIQEAFAYINTVNAAHPTDLPNTLATNFTIRLQYTRAHLLLRVPAMELPFVSPQRSEVYNFYHTMMTDYPQFYHRFPTLNRSLYPTMVQLRERVFKTASEIRFLDPTVKSQIITAAGLTGKYLDIFNDLGVMALDNASLDNQQLDFLHNFLTSVPTNLHNLRSITVNEFFGTSPVQIPFDGLPGVNIFGVRITNSTDSSFPSDVAPGYIATFCAATAHEVNHIVDSYGINGTPSLNARKQALIAAAGRDHLNYLRSMFSDGFFADNPQEFFASIANEWFTDSAKTVQLGLVRFNQGWREPLNQAIFFADVYSQGSNTTFFYTINTLGQIQRTTALLQRDATGNIYQMDFGGATYHFNVDTNGNVMSYLPAITTQPQSQVVQLGTNVGLTGAAIGMPPLTYQWRLNGTNMVGATNATLTISNITATQTGGYTVNVGSPGGSTLSQPALVVAVPKIGLQIMGSQMLAGLVVEGTIGASYAIQYTTNLQNSNSWITLTNLLFTNSVQLWIDMDSANSARRFYRSILLQ